MNDITEHIKCIQEKIKIAASYSKNQYRDIRLIAVTKTVDTFDIQKAIDAGLNEFGENRVQEMIAKYAKLPKDIIWHLIGQLQANKVKYIVDKVGLIHSLDRISLAQEIQRQCEKISRIMPVLIQVNIAKEETKSGIFEEDIVTFTEEISKFPNLEVQGLMTIAPLVDNPESIRPIFRKMKYYFEQFKKQSIPNVQMNYLSMGMSNDFEIAIEEGANVVRIGTAIFGKR